MAEDLKKTKFAGYSRICDEHPARRARTQTGNKKCPTNHFVALGNGYKISKALPRFGRALGSGDGTRTHDLGVMNPSL